MSSDYYTHVRHDVLRFLPSGREMRVLELGCGAGRTGGYLLRTGVAGRVVGVELDPDAASEARQTLDRVIVGNLDTLELPGDEVYDLVLCADVIEHVIDPWEVVARATAALVPGGWLVTSTPNIRYWKVIADLMRGRWEYTDHGIMDRTHLRFFTRETIQRLHEQLGHTIEAIGYAELSGKRALLDRVTGARLRDFLSGQHVVRSRKPSAG